MAEQEVLYTIKPLQWKHHRGDDFESYTAYVRGLNYHVVKFDNGKCFWSSSYFKNGRECVSIEDGKEKANCDWRSRVGEDLQPATSPSPSETPHT